MTKRNATIDLMKFVFAIAIVLHHTCNFYSLPKSGDCIAISGYLAVEFFFIVSGYYFMKRIATTEHNDVFREDLLYIKERYIKIFAFLLLSVIAGNIFTEICKQTTPIVLDGVNFNVSENYSAFLTVVYEVSHSFSDLFLLQMFGFRGTWSTGVSWYLSAMFIVFFVVYPLAVKKRKLFVEYLAPITVLFIFGYLFGVTGTLNGPGEKIGIIYKGLLRAFADVLLGCIAYYLVEKLNKIDLSRSTKRTLSIFELGGFLLSFGYMVGTYHFFSYEGLILILLFLSIIFALSKHNIVNELLNEKVCGFLGAFSLSVYLNHYYVSYNIARIFPSFSARKLLVVYFSFVIVLSIFNYIVGKSLTRIVLKKFGDAKNV